MWLKWFPWQYVVRRIALAKGFIDPVGILAQIQRFSQPSEVLAPVELLRISAVLHARGLMNAQAIQHNLDWIWPYWVTRQFNPNDKAFVPRAFSLTHINLTHRNWTAVGLPGLAEYPLVDPRGLVTPLYDGWSIDSWVITDGGHLIPSHQGSASQELVLEGNLAVATKAAKDEMEISSRVEVFQDEKIPVCHVSIAAQTPKGGWLVISVRPFNPEGVSFIRNICLLRKENGFKINHANSLFFNEPPSGYNFSNYRQGDVYRKLAERSKEEGINCPVGMATAAAFFELESARAREIMFEVPLRSEEKKHSFQIGLGAAELWQNETAQAARLHIPDGRIQFLFEAAVKTLVLHSPDEVYPGPYTYKHFWFRDAVMIAYAMLCSGMLERTKKIIDSFPARQKANGYFHSQAGEWDSNGQVLWLMHQYCRVSGNPPQKSWMGAIRKAARWIQKKRLPDSLGHEEAGLFPPGFSAEHLGPNDYYYWDDFWGVAGLEAASRLLETTHKRKLAFELRIDAENFLRSIEHSVRLASAHFGEEMMPASPNRRMDAGAVGSLVASYPLKLWPAGDPRILATINYLMSHCFHEGAFFHDVSHSGINPYLTLHVAQCLLRAGDGRFFDVLGKIAALASPTGQWPEAIHPQSLGGCMGDGQHVWA
ncbi:MAG: hypothetical protein HY586_03375, partial [Candidatus Omnitrophica bacterium]|nr:hypothetical protein [Candidatus Omnitrophota bacterium]